MSLVERYKLSKNEKEDRKNVPKINIEPPAEESKNTSHDAMQFSDKDFNLHISRDSNS